MMDTEILRRCYAAFNARDLEGALATMHPAVHWPNGWEGGWVEGRDGVRRYWERQWAAIDPHVEPRAFRLEPDGGISVSGRLTRACSCRARSLSSSAWAHRSDVGLKGSVGWCGREPFARN